LIGDRVNLMGWKQFRGGLDVKNNTTGKQSVFTSFSGVEIMFHVSTLIPYTPGDAQQVERKRHLGNDVVIVLFKEGNTPFDPTVIKSQFNHVFIVVTPIEYKGKACYRVEVCSKREVPPFGPLLPSPSIFEKTELREFILTKYLNAERGAMNSPAFHPKLLRTRKTLLDDIATTDYKAADKVRKTKSSTDLTIRRGSMNPNIDRSRESTSSSTTSSTHLPPLEATGSLRASKDPSSVALVVKSPDMELKTTVSWEISVADLKKKLCLRFPGNTETWKLHCADLVFDDTQKLSFYSAQLKSHDCHLEFK